MNFLPNSIEKLIEALRILPGVGQKTAERLTFFMLKTNNSSRENLGNSILNLKKNLRYCEDCFHFAESEKCAICQNLDRDNKILCIVEDSLDLATIEKAGVYKGLFHVLGGLISPLDGVGPTQLKIAELENRIKNGKFDELILALNPSLEGEATSIHILQKLKNFDIKITRLSRGIPMGGDLEFTDEGTLKRAFEGRVIF
jgi:recombination protein RecR